MERALDILFLFVPTKFVSSYFQLGNRFSDYLCLRDALPNHDLFYWNDNSHTTVTLIHLLLLHKAV